MALLSGLYAARYLFVLYEPLAYMVFFTRHRYVVQSPLGLFRRGAANLR